VLRSASKVPDKREFQVLVLIFKEFAFKDKFRIHVSWLPFFGPERRLGPPMPC